MIFHDVQQNSEDWEALRLGKVTASKFSTFMANDGKAFGDPAKRYALQVALELATGKKSDFSFKNDDMERGHEQEPLARMLYEDENFVDVTNGGFFDWGNFGDSPDGLVGGDGVIEIKSVIAPTHYATLMRGSFDPAYRWQLIGHLDCTGREWVDFVSFCADFPEGKQLITNRLYKVDYISELNQLSERRAQFLDLVEATLNRLGCV
jgi:YqaJ-like recombinase protein